MIAMRFAFFLVAAALATVSFAQEPLTGLGQFPEWRTLSGLPGGGFGVKADGTPSLRGAFALSSPIAYSLGNRHVALGISNVSFDHQLRLPARSQGNSNGTMWAMLGLGGESWGDLTVGGTIISIPHGFPGRNALNLQYTPPVHVGPVKFGVGMQDVTGNAGSSGEALENKIGRGHSNSAFAVATADLGNGVFLSAGTGTQRFRRSFVNGSASVTDRFKVFLEHDGFNFNYGVATELGPLLGGESEDANRGSVVMMLGLVRSRYLGWSVNLTF